MERSWIYRALAYLLLSVVGFGAVAPSVAGWFGRDDLVPGWFKKRFDRRIQLGLDLQGGLHIVYKVDVERAVGHRTDRLASEVEERLRKEKKISGLDISRS